MWSEFGFDWEQKSHLNRLIDTRVGKLSSLQNFSFRSKDRLLYLGTFTMFRDNFDQTFFAIITNILSDSCRKLWKNYQSSVLLVFLYILLLTGTKWDAESKKEPCHEIMALFILHKLILQTRIQWG